MSISQVLRDRVHQRGAKPPVTSLSPASTAPAVAQRLHTPRREVAELIMAVLAGEPARAKV